MSRAGEFALLGPRIARDKRFWKQQEGPLAREGFLVVPQLLPTSECEALVEFARPVVAEQAKGSARSRMLAENAWVVSTDPSQARYDHRLTRMMNAHHLNPLLARLAQERRFEELFEAQLGRRVLLRTVSIQVDEPDTVSKRGWHVDTYTPPTLKAFVYLTDVPDSEHGPYTVIPGSHRHLGRKLANRAINTISGRPATDLPLGYRNRDARLFTEPAGTAILSVQSLAHRGWPTHTKGTRFMIVAYLVFEDDDPGTEFALGRPTASG